ncbi:hypothetical protein I0P70_12700 [Pontibacter sp. FD36]|uniref:GDSL-type esterase/lipase family protein n=1 Tax=Pontibacter sp. FD36 TaxID=2789860 RepID=UPI0018AA25F0|nr:GDSL-type esterase/lipase family protein [Pontibacter sp. FD36]MBF8964107.1 hypothetical protein [Pontibacter sp. FD36]
MKTGQRSRLSSFFVALLGLLSFATSTLLAQDSLHPAKWEKEIRAFERKDSLDMPAKGGIVFTGSSSIKRWTSLPQEYPDYPIIMRGFGGSRLGDATFYFGRIVKKYQPRQVFLYSGENDIAAGSTSEMTFKEFKAFARKMKKELPKAELVYLSIKPSISRWDRYPTMQVVNQKIKRYALWHRKVKFLDVSSPMIGTDGMPKAELFLSDKLHMTATGYNIWRSIIEPHLAD